MAFENAEFSNVRRFFGVEAKKIGTEGGGCHDGRPGSLSDSRAPLDCGQVIEPFRSQGGLLTTSTETKVSYVAGSAGHHFLEYLATQLVVLARGHIRQGFIDLINASQERDVLRGIQAYAHICRSGRTIAAPN